MKHFRILVLLFLLNAWSSCDSGPKVIEAEEAAMTPGTLSSPNIAAPNLSPVEEHKVVVQEVLDTEKYSYLNVKENDDQYWIAISKRPVKTGGTYYFRGGLLKKNFYSREHDRVFETVYLVSNFRAADPMAEGGSGSGSAVDKALSKIKGNALVDDSPINVSPAEGAIRLSELFSNKEKYEGKTIRVTGKVVKINPMIMKRNWIHIQDGSVEGKDLTVTTTENIPLGHVVTVEGTIALNKDFGAGYRYDIIMEGAVLNKK